MTDAEREAALETAAETIQSGARAQGLFNEAFAHAIEHRRIPIGKLHTHYYSDASSDRTVNVESATRERSFLIVAQEAKPEPIAGGRYRLSQLTAVSAKDGTTTKQHHFACMCSVPVEKTFVARVQFPDIYSLYAQSDRPTDLHNNDIGALQASETKINAAGVRRALENAAMYSSDPFLGYVTLSIEFGISDPETFVGVVQNAHSNTAVGASDTDGRGFRTQQEAFEARFRNQLEGESGDPTLKISRPGMIGRMIDLIKGKREMVDSRLLEPMQTITFADIYPALRFELMRTISSALLAFSADVMRQEPEQREKLESSIVKYMGKTLAKFGLCVKRVADFQFISEEYNEILKLSGKVATEREINTLKTKILENQEQLQEAERKAEILRLENQISVDEVRIGHDGRRKALELVDRIKRESMLADAKRDARAKDHDLEMKQRVDELEFYRKALAVHGEYKKLQFDDMQRRLDYYKTLPPDQAFLFLLNENPALRDAFVAREQANSAEARLEAERGMRTELMKLQDTHGDVLKNLLVVGAEQVGKVAQKVVEGQRGIVDGRVVDAK